MGDISSDPLLPSGSSDNDDLGGFSNPLADELVAIAARLRDVASAVVRDENRTTQPRQHATRTGRGHLAYARKVYAMRRRRAAIFGNPDLFGEPAWDILLDLYIAHADGKSVSVSSACIGSAAPATTGLRWLGVLADAGLIVRENDADDQRRVMVRLSADGLSAMEVFFDAVESFN